MGQIKAHSPPTSLNSTRGLGKLGVSANTPETHPSYLSNKRAPKQQQQVRLGWIHAYAVWAFAIMKTQYTCMRSAICRCTSHAWWHVIGSGVVLVRFTQWQTPETRTVLKCIHFWYWHRVSIVQRLQVAALCQFSLWKPKQESTTCIVQWLQRVHACLQRRWCLHGGIKHVSAFSVESLVCLVFCPSHPLFLPLILDMNSEPVVESKQPTHQCTQWLLIKSQTVLSYIAPMGLGNRKERARLDRCCFLAARLRGWG